MSRTRAIAPSDLVTQRDDDKTMRGRPRWSAPLAIGALHRRDRYGLVRESCERRTMPRSIARATASDRLPAPSLAKACAMCQFTVRSPMPRADAISFEVSPRATCSRTSISRLDSDIPTAESRSRTAKSKDWLIPRVMAKPCLFRHPLRWPGEKFVPAPTGNE